MKSRRTVVAVYRKLSDGVWHTRFMFYDKKANCWKFCRRKKVKP